ncbi:response regulator [Nitrincola sp. MINF-07-Sa-05]|uniref:response regulator n=1 Tax=Nitrincola salilacus TaxID=3400273 RepID=UPI003918176C
MSGRILVIEDNQANLELMVYLLEAFGYEVLTAQDGGEGLERAVSHRPDLIICDIQMPVMDGYEVVRKLKSDPALSHIPVMAVTAFAMVGDRQKVMEAGFDDYFTKPIDPKEFLKQVEASMPSRTSGR